MRLHTDKEAFQVLLNITSEKTRIRMDIIEKDYYITLMLEELSKKQDMLPAYFKGGTALYKALGTLRRFSEDIDLTVEIKDCSKSQGKKRLEKAANGYVCLNRTESKELESNTKGSITSVYEYETITEIDSNDVLQRFGIVKVEATSFTVSEPFESLQIEALVYKNAEEEQKRILEDQYDVKPFDVNTIKIERIFADKILAAEFYYERSLLFDVSKHLYDIAVLMKEKRIQQLLQNEESLRNMLSYKRMEERERIGSDLNIRKFSDFKIFKEISNNKMLNQNFDRMQSIYVFDEDDIISYNEMTEDVMRLAVILLKLREAL